MYQGKNQCQGKTPAEKESRKILPDDREGELRDFSAASEEKGAAGNPITTWSFNRDTHAKSLAPWGMKMAFYRTGIPPLYPLNEG
nr:hypothetical protein [Alkalicoccus halolimnae]TXF83271.1 hypothetical protein FTX54_12885 [Alkalicoccus halolimnae]